MADLVDEKQQHLDDRADGPVFQLVPTPKKKAPGFSSSEATAFLRGLKPIVRAGQRLGDVVKKAKPKG